jgi:glutathione S-transferase
MPLLVMGNKNYSSWSVRPWFFFVQAGIECEVRVIPLDTPTFREEIAHWSPTRRVPVLRMPGGDVVWDTLAIGEAVAEEWPEAGVWPDDIRLRRLARSACAEMHAGFAALRKVLCCNARRRYADGAWRTFAGSSDRVMAVESDLARMCELWRSLLEASGGPFLGGARFGYVDAYFAPVVSRFATYAIESADDLTAYRNLIEGLPAWQTWMQDAAAEPWTLAHEEY